MQDDLSDAVAWAVAEGIADPGRVAIMGVSYGGFAVLAGLTMTPDLYSAGVALNPVSDLVSQLTHWDKIRPAWRTKTDLRQGRMPRYTEGERSGEVKDEADWNAADLVLIEDLRRRSPITWVENIQAPLLIAHGAEDPRVLEADSARFVAACEALGADVEYVVFEGEGHWLGKPENYEKYYELAEELLGRTIGAE